MKRKRRRMLRNIVQKFGKKRVLSGSYTVEASFLVPFILLTILGGIRLGYQLYQETVTAVEIQEEILELNPIEIVRRNQQLHEIKELL